MSVLNVRWYAVYLMGTLTIIGYIRTYMLGMGGCCVLWSGQNAYVNIDFFYTCNACVNLEGQSLSLYPACAVYVSGKNSQYLRNLQHAQHMITILGGS